MGIQKGSDIVIALGDGETAEAFTVISGIQATNFRVRNRLQEINRVNHGKWRELTGGTAISNLTVEGEGVFHDSDVEHTLRQAAFASTINNYELRFGNGDVLSGAFLVADYRRIGEINGEERYQIRLESAGEITYV